MRKSVPGGRFTNARLTSDFRPARSAVTMSVPQSNESDISAEPRLFVETDGLDVRHRAQTALLERPG